MKPLRIIHQITRRETDSFSKYLVEIARLGKDKPLTIEEEMNLSLRIKKGDVKAEKELIERNLRFVVSVAKQYQTEGCTLEDLVGEGNVGIVKAAKKFDSSRGCKFISYAVWLIRQTILCYITDNQKSIRLPLNKVGQISKIKKAQEKLEQKLNRKPTTDEIIDLLDFEISAAEIDSLFLLDMGTQSINVEFSSVGNSKAEGFTIEDNLTDASAPTPHNELDKQDLNFIINKVLNNFSNNHKLVIKMYYGLEGSDQKTLEEISIILGLSRERIRQIKNQSLRMLGNRDSKKLLEPFLT